MKMSIETTREIEVSIVYDDEIFFTVTDTKTGCNYVIGGITVLGEVWFDEIIIKDAGLVI